MRRTFKYRLYPTKDQQSLLVGTFKFCRFLYNNALEERIAYYKKYGKSLSYVSQANQLTEVKRAFAEQTQNIYSQVLQQVLRQLDSAYANFFRRVKAGSGAAGFPRFKGEDRFRSICYPQVKPFLDGGAVKLVANNNKVKISNIGEVSIVYHRPIQGKAKLCRIVRQGDQWYLTVSCDDVPKSHLPQAGKVIGIDLGVNNFITTDDGTTFHNPKPYKTSKEKLAYLNQKLSRKRLGSNNRRKTKKSLRKFYQKVSDIRIDWQHKVSNQLIKDNDVIIVEDLNINKMLTSNNFKVSNQSITEASWGNFVSQLHYKAESAGRVIIEVNPANTSKTCSHCNNIKDDLKLTDRIYNCNACGVAIDRDINAAINIKGLGMSLAAQDKLCSLS